MAQHDVTTPGSTGGSTGSYLAAFAGENLALKRAVMKARREIDELPPQSSAEVDKKVLKHVEHVLEKSKDDLSGTK